MALTKNNNALGSLSIVSTPIGNLDDITIRAISTLKEADFIYAEDTRRARKLLNHLEIQCATTSYNKDNEARKTSSLLRKVQEGERLVLIVDSGTPCISDPGFHLVRQALEQDIEPEIIPGVSALTYAVVACGFPVSEFRFIGFLPRKKLKRRTRLKELSASCETFFLFESRHRIKLLLKEIVEEIGPDTRLVLIREATKLYEENIRGSALQLLELSEGCVWKGEFTVAVTTR